MSRMKTTRNEKTYRNSRTLTRSKGFRKTATEAQTPYKIMPGDGKPAVSQMAITQNLKSDQKLKPGLDLKGFCIKAVIASTLSNALR